MGEVVKLNYKGLDGNQAVNITAQCDYNGDIKLPRSSFFRRKGECWIRYARRLWVECCEANGADGVKLTVHLPRKDFLFVKKEAELYLNGTPAVWSDPETIHKNAASCEFYGILFKSDGIEIQE